MTPIQALRMLNETVSSMKGTREEHDTLKQAVQVLNALVLKSGNVPPAAPPPVPTAASADEKKKPELVNPEPTSTAQG